MIARPALVGLTMATIAGGWAAARPAVRDENGQTVVQGDAYRVTFARESMDAAFELKGADGEWRDVTKSPNDVCFAYVEERDLYLSNGLRATWALAETKDAVVVGRQAVLDAVRGIVLDLHFVCVDDGALIRARLSQRAPGEPSGTLWCPPRIQLQPGDWDEYAFWAADGRRHAGKLADLGGFPTYAGVSAWGREGDTVERLDPRHPALIAKSAAWGVGLGVVFLDYARAWGSSAMFLQRHTPAAFYLYGGYTPAAGERARWAWLAPFPREDAQAETARVEMLLGRGEAIARAFRPVSLAAPDEWTRPLPDFPAKRRRPKPVRDINQAVVYTVNEFTRSDHGIDLARKVGSDVLIRGWFKWGNAPPVDQYRDIPVKAHEMGALFGGGITCSALYDGENGLSEEQVLDMATRGPAGQLIDAWGEPGVRHGSLSSPAYLDYLFRWCREQIDAGADYLFMDEHTAAIGGLEGYDDHSLADFRRYLLEACPQTKGWAPDDARWGTELKINLQDRRVCPTGKMDSFDYRAYMRDKGVLENPNAEANALRGLWGQFRSYRDDRAWRELTDRIRAYAKQKGRTVLISANGIAKYVDLQVLGVWGRWMTQDGHIDLGESQLPQWRSLVLRGRDVAAKRVPVVLFHDWGFGDPPFPWLAVPPSEREVWMRTRGAEIYAAGAFFAFPVLGPFGCDASKDGTLRTIAKQTAFYQAHRNLYLNGRYLGSDALQANAERLSLAAWWSERPRGVLVHVINRDPRDGRLQKRSGIIVRLPLGAMPEKATAISPDWDGERVATCRKLDDGLQITLPELDAYAVAILRYSGEVDVSALADPVRIRPDGRWARPTRSEFRVRPDCSVESAHNLNGFLQGMLHTDLRNPPTFLVNAESDGRLLVRVRAVATLGARLEYRVDGETKQTVDLPDLDGKNDGGAPEYDRTLAFPIPAGRHRLSLDNVGGDWATVSWYQFEGTFGEWGEGEP